MNYHLEGLNPWTVTFWTRVAEIGKSGVAWFRDPLDANNEELTGGWTEEAHARLSIS